MNTQRGYDAIKALAKDTGLTIPNLIVLANQNDPFYAGQPAQRIKAEWFAELWERFGYSTGVHLRRVHYQLVSQHGPTRHDGTPYENTELCWNYLCDAGKAARYLSLVDPEAFEDHRNPAPTIYAPGADGEGEPGYYFTELRWSLPSIQTSLPWFDLRMPEPIVEGYKYDDANQPYHVELWVEKSTMDDVLTPVCRRLGLNLVTSLGFQSITSVVDLLKRIRRTEKPARIYYISDFDPAGDSMPVAVARQVEYWLADFAPDSDIKLTPIALTLEQVQAYRLPRIPVKDSDKRKAGFQERYGEGAVELDALEALYPGTLAEIVRQAVKPYRDETLAERLDDARSEAQRNTRAAWQEATQYIRPELRDVENEARAVFERFRGELEALAARLDADLTPLQERLELLRQAVEEQADDFEPELPGRPEAETEPTDESEWLFDASRDYMEQLAVYKDRRNRPGAAVA